MQSHHPSHGTDSTIARHKHQCTTLHLMLTRTLSARFLDAVRGDETRSQADFLPDA